MPPRARQMKSAQADAQRMQLELAATDFEGFSSDETVRAVVDGAQARGPARVLVVFIELAACALGPLLSARIYSLARRRARR